MNQVYKVKPYKKNKFDVNENGKYYVLSFDDSNNYKVTAEAEFIISQFDGFKNLDEIYEIIVAKGIKLSKVDLIDFVDQFIIKNNLIEGMKFKKKSETSKLWFHLPILQGEKLAPFLRIFNFLFIKRIFLFQFLFFLFIQIFFCISRRYLADIDKIWGNNTFIVLIVLLLSSIFHEIGHASAANYYGCKIGKIGVGLYLFKPVFFIDLSSTWKIDRKSRIVVDMGGIYFQIVMVNILSVILLFCDISELKLSMISIIVLAILNLNPFLRLDGYWILTDWLGIVNVNNRMFDLVKYNLNKYIFRNERYEGNRKLNISNSGKIILYSYMFIYLVFTVLAFALGVFMIMQLFVGKIDFVSMFLDIVISFEKRSFAMFFTSINKFIVKTLPYIYMIIMIYSVFKSKKQETEK